MDLKHAKKVHLNQYTHAVRASQAVLQYGVGAMVDFPNQTLMTAAPEYWKEQIAQIHDERLEKALRVDYFGLPLGQDDPQSRDGISYVRFPEWYFCPKCRRFQSINNWKKDFLKHATAKQVDVDPEMVKKVQCPTCHQELVVTRIVTACECGHIDDFPWEKWVHCQNMFGGSKPVCKNARLTFKTSASSTEGLEGLTITCETCGARATLKGAFDAGKLEDLDKKTDYKYDFKCAGRHPWKNTKEECDKYPKVLQRGSSSVYFPITASSLVIPPYSTLITQKIESSSAFQKQKEVISSLKHNPSVTAEMVAEIIKGGLEQNAKEIALEIGVSEKQVKPILERKWTIAEPEEVYSTASVKYRAEEYEALSGEVSLQNEGDFIRESTNASDYSIPGVKGISLIHKIREVQALIGFSRLSPVEVGNIGETSNHAVSVKQEETDWYPAYQVRGEGIFIELDSKLINDWIKKNEAVEARVRIINENYEKSYTGSNRPRNITAKFLLIHTLSHLLMKQLSFECGYSIASIKERIYCSDASAGKDMAGIFIYTASGDSEGTLGGLVRQGRPDVFPGIFKKAIETAMTCSNDPVCSLSQGQGREMLNLSACYSCCLVPETSCEEFNILLDRGMVVGTYKDRNMGFYSPQLYEGAPWTHDSTIDAEETISGKQNKKMIIIDGGINVSESSYEKIWEAISDWVTEPNEKENVQNLIGRTNDFVNIEKPNQDCIFQITGSNIQYSCDLYWPNQGVALFTAENQEGYLLAKDSDVTCFYLNDLEFNVEKILAALRKGER